MPKSLDLTEVLAPRYRDRTVDTLLKNLFNRHLAKPDTVPFFGFVGNPGPLQPGEVKLNEPTLERQLNQLAPVVYYQHATEEVLTTWPELVQKLLLQGVDYETIGSWFKTGSYNLVPPIDLDKFCNFNEYLWVGGWVKAYQSTDFSGFGIDQWASIVASWSYFYSSSLHGSAPTLAEAVEICRYTTATANGRPADYGVVSSEVPSGDGYVVTVDIIDHDGNHFGATVWSLTPNMAQVLNPTLSLDQPESYVIERGGTASSWSTRNLWVHRDDALAFAQAHGLDVGLLEQATRPIIEYGSDLELDGTDVRTRTLGQPPLFNLYTRTGARLLDGAGDPVSSALFYYQEDPAAPLDPVLQRNVALDANGDFLFEHALVHPDTQELLYYKDGVELRTAWAPGPEVGPEYVKYETQGTLINQDKYANFADYYWVGADKPNPYDPLGLPTYTVIEPGGTSGWSTCNFWAHVSKLKHVDLKGYIQAAGPITELGLGLEPELVNVRVANEPPIFKIYGPTDAPLADSTLDAYVAHGSPGAFVRLWPVPPGQPYHLRSLAELTTEQVDDLVVRADPALRDGTWTVPPQLWWNPLNETRAVLKHGDLFSHLTSIIGAQPGLTGTAVGSNGWRNLTPDLGLGGLIKQYDQSVGLLVSLMLQEGVTVVALLDFARESYEGLAVTVEAFIEDVVPTLLLDRTFDPAVEADLTNVLVPRFKDYLARRSAVVDASASPLDDHLAAPFYDTTSSISNLVVTLPYLGLAPRVLPALEDNPATGLPSLRHHDGHHTNVATVPSNLYKRLATKRYLRSPGQEAPGFITGSGAPTERPYRGQFWFKVNTGQLFFFDVISDEVFPDPPPTASPRSTVAVPVDLREGDLWYDRTANVLWRYDGAAWVVSADLGAPWTVVALDDLNQKLTLALEVELYDGAPSTYPVLDEGALLDNAAYVPKLKVEFERWASTHGIIDPYGGTTFVGTGSGGGQVELLWRTTVDFRYAQQKVFFKLDPLGYVSVAWGTQFDPGQVSQRTGRREAPADFILHGDLLPSGEPYVSTGLNQLYVQYHRVNGQDLTVSRNLSALRGWTTKLGYRFGGLIDTDLLDVRAYGAALIPSALKVYVKENKFNGSAWINALRVQLVQRGSTVKDGTRTVPAPGPGGSPGEDWTYRVDTYNSRRPELTWDVFDLSAPAATFVALGGARTLYGWRRPSRVIGQRTRAAPFLVTGIQHVVDLILGYASRLQAVGWRFNDLDRPVLDPDTGRQLDYQLLVEKFIDQQFSGVSAGAALVVNPFFRKVQLSTPHGVLSDLHAVLGLEQEVTCAVLDEAGRSLSRGEVRVFRQDATAFITFDRPVYSFHALTSEYEHVVLFEGYSVDTLLLDPFLGQRIPAIFVRGERQHEFTGRLDLGGSFMLGHEMRRNLESSVGSILRMYDAGSNDALPEVKRAKAALGFWPKPYFGARGTSSNTEFRFWQGLIAHKGTNFSIAAFINSAKYKTAALDECWAYKLARYGAADAVVRSELKVEPDDCTTDLTCYLLLEDGETVADFYPYGYDVAPYDTVPYDALSLETESFDPRGMVVIDPDDEERWYQLADLESLTSLPLTVLAEVTVTVASLDDLVTVEVSGAPVLADCFEVVDLTYVGDPALGGTYYEQGNYIPGTDPVRYDPPKFMRSSASTLRLLDAGLLGKPLKVVAYGPALREYAASLYDYCTGTTAPGGALWWDPARGFHPPAALSSVDYRDGVNPARYNATLLPRNWVEQREATRPWGEGEVGRTWWDLNGLAWKPYYDSRAYPDVYQRLAAWGALADGSAVKVYEWVRSTVPPEGYSVAAGDGSEVIKLLLTRRRTWWQRPVAWRYSDNPAVKPRAFLTCQPALLKLTLSEGFSGTGTATLDAGRFEDHGIVKDTKLAGAVYASSDQVDANLAGIYGTAQVTSDRSTISTETAFAATPHFTLGVEVISQIVEFRTPHLGAYALSSAHDPVTDKYWLSLTYVPTGSNQVIEIGDTPVTAGTQDVYFFDALGVKLLYTPSFGYADAGFTEPGQRVAQVAAEVGNAAHVITLKSTVSVFAPLPFLTELLGFWIAWNDPPTNPLSGPKPPLNRYEAFTVGVDADPWRVVDAYLLDQASDITARQKDPWSWFDGTSVNPYKQSWTDWSLADPLDASPVDLTFDPDIADPDPLVVVQHRYDYPATYLALTGRYYFWVRGKATTAVGKALSVKAVEAELTQPSGITVVPQVLKLYEQVPPFRPNRHCVLALRNLGSVVRGRSSYKLRVTRDPSLGWSSPKERHEEWVTLRKYSPRLLPRALWDKLTDSLAGETVDGGLLPSPSYQAYDARNGTTERYGFGPGQVLVDPQVGLATLRYTIVNPQVKSYVNGVPTVDLVSYPGFDVGELDAYTATPVAVRAFMADLWNLATPKQLNEIFFEVLEDIAAVNLELTDIFKTSYVSLSDIRVLNSNLQPLHQTISASVTVDGGNGGGGGDVGAWTIRAGASDTWWSSVTYGNGLFVAVSFSFSLFGHRVMTSPDGVTWTLRDTPVSDESGAHADISWASVTFGGGLFVAVASDGTGLDQVMTSPDGAEWTMQFSPSKESWASIAYGNGIFVAVAPGGAANDNTVMTSTDGINWTGRGIPGGVALAIAVTYGNGVFVVVSELAGAVITSPDGIVWTTRAAANDNPWISVAYGNGLFVAVSVGGSGNRVMTSPDGVTWTARTSAADNSWVSVTFGGGEFAAVSQDGSGNRVMTSPDGVTWTARTSAADKTWFSVTYGADKFVAVGGPEGGGTDNVMTST